MEVWGSEAPFLRFLPAALKPCLLAFETHIYTMARHMVPMGWGRYWSSVLICHPKHREFTHVLCSDRKGFLLCLRKEYLMMLTALLKCHLSPLSMLSHFNRVRLLGPDGFVVRQASSLHGILQEKIVEWVARPSSKGSSQPRGRTRDSCVSCIGRWVIYHQHHLGNPHSPLKGPLSYSKRHPLSPSPVFPNASRQWICDKEQRFQSTRRGQHLSSGTDSLVTLGKWPFSFNVSFRSPYAEKAL